MKEKRKVFEKDLFEPIHEYFEKLGYEVHGEVKSCDITAVKGDELIIVELKRNLSVELLIQAVKRQKVTESVYIAIPKPSFSVFSRKWKDLCFLVKRLELGLITVSFKSEIEEVEIFLTPKLFDRQKSTLRNKKKKGSIINEVDGRHGNYNVGGTTRVKLMTSYKEKSIHIACCLKRFGPLSPAKLREFGTGDKTQSILSKNFYGWFESVSKGIYKLNDIGNEKLSEYSELATYYEDVINKSILIKQ